MGTRAQKYPQVVGTCPAYNHQLIAQNQSPRKIRHHQCPTGGRILAGAGAGTGGGLFWPVPVPVPVVEFWPGPVPVVNDIK